MAKIELLSKSLRLIGETESPAIEINQTAVQSMGVYLNMNKDDLDDDEMHIKVEIFVSKDGIKFNKYGHYTYDGGTFERKGPPGMSVSKVVPGNKVKTKVHTNKTCPLGIYFEDNIDFSRMLP